MARDGRASRIVAEALSDGRIRTLSEMRSLGVSPQTLRRMVDDGRISSPGHGLYQAADVEFDPREQFATVARLVPTSMVWLVSAAAMHGITQVMPADLWIAVPGSHRGTVELGGAYMGPPVRATRLSRERDFLVGVENVTVHGVDVRVTSAARTVVDLWRYSSLNASIQAQFRKVDDETFLDALTNFLSPARGGGDISELADVAERLGVLTGIEPHLKAMSYVSSMIP